MTRTITDREAYLAMIAFLEHYWRNTNSDDVASLLGSMDLLNDGMPADRAMWDEWQDAIAEALRKPSTP